MSKPTTFGNTLSEEFEPALVSAWGKSGMTLTEADVRKTRKQIVDLRLMYTHHGDPVGTLRFDRNKNQAGYLGAFGQRHALLPYEHLKRIEATNPELVPQPNAKGELTVTIVGAAAALELYGVLLYYNENTARVRRLHVNLLDKVKEWSPVRDQVIGQLLKQKFPKTSIYREDIVVDIASQQSIRTLVQNHDKFASSDILMVYNVLNEIPEHFADRVWRTIRTLLWLNEKASLMMVAEPTNTKVAPRVNWLIERLATVGTQVAFDPRAVVQFDHEPVALDLEGTGVGPNDRLFTRVKGEPSPTFQTSITRLLYASYFDPRRILPIEAQVAQYREASRPRSRRLMRGSRRPLWMGKRGLDEGLGNIKLRDAFSA